MTGGRDKPRGLHERSIPADSEVDESPAFHPEPLRDLRVVAMAVHCGGQAPRIGPELSPRRASRPTVPRSSSALRADSTTGGRGTYLAPGSTLLGTRSTLRGATDCCLRERGTGRLLRRRLMALRRLDSGSSRHRWSGHLLHALLRFRLGADRPCGRNGLGAHPRGIARDGSWSLRGGRDLRRPFEPHHLRAGSSHGHTKAHRNLNRCSAPQGHRQYPVQYGGGPEEVNQPGSSTGRRGRSARFLFSGGGLRHHPACCAKPGRRSTRGSELRI